MKNKFKFLATMLIGILLSTNVWGTDPETIYYETFGTANSNTAWASFSGWSNNQTTSIASTTNWSVSAKGTMTCDVDGSSGNSHTYSGTNGGTLIFNFGDLSNDYTDVKLSLYFQNNRGKNNPRTMTCQLSGDGGSTWGDDILPYTGSQDWASLSNFAISASLLGNLSIKITNTANNVSRIEDIKLVGTPAQTCTHSITITKGSTNHGTFDLSQTGAVCIDEGSATVSVTNIAPESHYVFDHITATNGSVDNEAKTVSNISANTEIAVVFREAEQVTVTWDDRGSTTNVQVWPGEPLVLPTDPTDMPTCAQYFVGWSTHTLTGEGHGAPSDLFKTAISAPETNTTYHAVFAQGEGTADEEKTLDLNFDGGGTTLTVTSAANVPNENVTINGVTLNLAYIDGTNGATRFQSVKNEQNPYIELRLCSGTAKGTVTITSTGLSSFKSIEVYAAQKENTNATGKISVGSTLKYTHSLTSATSTSSGEINLGTDAQNIKIECTTGQYRIQRMIIKGIIDGGGIEYSNYVTSCAVYTVTFKSNGVDVTTVSNVAPGQQVTAPTLAYIKSKVAAKNVCTDYLVGWSTDSHYSNPSAAPSDILKPNAEGKITIPSDITEDVVYHAVYADVAGE